MKKRAIKRQKDVANCQYKRKKNSKSGALFVLNSMGRVAFAVLLLSNKMRLAHHFAHLAVCVDHNVQALCARHSAASVKGVCGSMACLVKGCCAVDTS